MDPVKWQPIDHNIITEIHENHDILPGCFPHNEFLKKNKSILPNNRTKGKNIPNIRRMRIQPDADVRKEARPTKRQLELTERAANNKRHKKSNRRERMKVVREIAKNEAQELAANQNLMDHFSIATDELNKSSNPTMEPVASRTRRRSLPASPLK